MPKESAENSESLPTTVIKKSGPLFHRKSLSDPGLPDPVEDSKTSLQTHRRSAASVDQLFSSFNKPKKDEKVNFNYMIHGNDKSPVNSKLLNDDSAVAPLFGLGLTRQKVLADIQHLLAYALPALFKQYNPKEWLYLKNDTFACKQEQIEELSQGKVVEIELTNGHQEITVNMQLTRKGSEITLNVYQPKYSVTQAVYKSPCPAPWEN